MTRRLLLVLIALLLGLQVALVAWAQPAGREVMVTDVEGVIDSVVARHVRRSIENAVTTGVEALVIRIDTPGGLDSSMREIVQAILASPVPVIVYVAPPGARAASAGVFIAYAAHVSAMAPGTNIGAASPVNLGGGQSDGDSTLLKKATNDAAAYVRSLAALRDRNADWAEAAVRDAVSVSAARALELNVVDLVAESVDELLAQIDGRRVRVNQSTRTLHTSEALLRPFQMGLVDGFIHKLADPNIAFILFTLAMTALTVELFNPGLIFPGVAGVIMLVLALFALGTLPIEPAGVALLVFAVALIVLETQVVSGGVLGVGAVIALILGGLLLFQPIGDAAPDVVRPVVEVSRVVIASLGGVLAALALLFVYFARFRRPALYESPASREALIGQKVRVTKRLDPDGEVRAAGEFWQARLPEGHNAAENSIVEIMELDGMTLRVEAFDEDAKQA